MLWFRSIKIKLIKKGLKMDLLGIIKGQKRYKGCTREQLILKTGLSPQAIDRKLAQLDKTGQIQKKSINKLVYSIK